GPPGESATRGGGRPAEDHRWRDIGSRRSRAIGPLGTLGLDEYAGPEPPDAGKQIVEIAAAHEGLHRCRGAGRVGSPQRRALELSIEVELNKHLLPDAVHGRKV